MTDKVIVTNISALKTKYGEKTDDVLSAVERLISADKLRGLDTVMIPLDDQDEMGKIGGIAVANPIDPMENKEAIDSVYNALLPDYLVLLGSIDVIPHQDMANPVFNSGEDDDVLADGDLPYACDSGYSQDAEDFIGPTRAVGRIPDLTGATDPGYLINLLETAITATSRPLTDFAGYFGISAAVWRGSTRLSLRNIFGTHTSLLLSPLDGPNWLSNQINKRLHFINCHGAPATHQFFGQSGNSFPPSHDASLLTSNIEEGTVVAAECCFGAELYDPFLLGGGQMGICSTYLAEKAYGFFGSTTIAYGPANTNGAADLICQYFLKSVLGGASLGRAALEARQKFASSSSQLDPVDLKTLAQFNLLGDPSICPVAGATPTKSIPVNSEEIGGEVHNIERKERRQQLRSKGRWLEQSQPVVSTKSYSEDSAEITSTMQNIADKFELKGSKLLSFQIKNPALSEDTLLSKSLKATAFHVLQGRGPSELEDFQDNGSSEQNSMNPMICIVAKEVNGKIVSFRELHKK